MMLSIRTFSIPKWEGPKTKPDFWGNNKVYMAPLASIPQPCNVSPCCSCYSKPLLFWSVDSGPKGQGKAGALPASLPIEGLVYLYNLAPGGEAHNGSGRGVGGGGGGHIIYPGCPHCPTSRIPFFCPAHLQHQPW